MTLIEWKDLATIIGTAVSIPVAGFAVFKGFDELRKNREQRDRDLKLKRVEFTLAQHRRLFDDPVLYSVMRFLDGDHPQLAINEMWDPKRKFLTFMEELCLLVNDGLVDRDIAHYMFGYYAATAYDGKNFREGIEWKPEFWGLFFAFAEETKVRPQPTPSEIMKLRF